MHDRTAIAVLDGGDILGAGPINPEYRALLMFLANRTAATRRAYEEDLRQFSEWLRNRMRKPSMLLADRLDLEMYLEHLTNERQLAQATIARRFGTVRLFLRHCYDEEIISQDPTRRTKAPKVDSDAQRRTWLSTVDMALVLRVAAHDARDYAIIVFMLDTAMRVGEVCSLNVDSVHRETGRVWVSFIGKGGKQARVDLPYRTLEALDRYLAGRTDGPLFTTATGSRIQRQHVARIIRRCAKAAGVTTDITPHGLRRTHARTAAEHGEDLLGIAEALRHKDVAVTKRSYVGEQRGRANMTRQRVADVYTNMAG